MLLTDKAYALHAGGAQKHQSKMNILGTVALRLSLIRSSFVYSKIGFLTLRLIPRAGVTLPLLHFQLTALNSVNSQHRCYCKKAHENP